jgi:hypothetical protein
MKGLLVLVGYLQGLYLIFPIVRRVTNDVLKECCREFGNCRLFFVYMIPRLHKCSFIGGYAVAQLAEALRYKPEGRGLDSRWGCWDYLLL